jgi:hypothetical protein
MQRRDGKALELGCVKLVPTRVSNCVTTLVHYASISPSCGGRPQGDASNIAGTVEMDK